MARTNSPGVLARWREAAPTAPFRASIDGDCHWDLRLPPPSLVAAARMVPGGRMLMAFGSAEVRDYFVHGHAGQGAKAEPDRAETATRRPARPAGAPAPKVGLDAALATSRGAQRRLALASAAVAEEFGVSVQAALDTGDDAGALAALRAVPERCHASIKLMSTLRDAGVWDRLGGDAGRVDAAMPTPSQAVCLLDWLRADEAADAAREVAAPLVSARVDELAEAGRVDDLEAFARTLPDATGYAFTMDRARRERIRLAKASGDPAAPSP